MKTYRLVVLAALLASITLLGAACGGGEPASTPAPDKASVAEALPEPMPLAEPAAEHAHEALAAMEGAAEVTIVAKEWAFAPETITVTQGEPVNIVFANAGVIDHDMVIDAFDFHVHIHEPGETYRVGFVPYRAGTFTFYCSIPGHLEAGMVATLVVEPASSVGLTSSEIDGHGHNAGVEMAQP